MIQCYKGSDADRYFIADWTRDMRHGGIGSMDAIARTQTKHGVGLGGYPWQRRARRRLEMQRLRRGQRQWDASEGEMPF